MHSVTSGGWTSCGIMNTTAADAFPFMQAFVTDDSVDCMTCLVQETHESLDSIAFQATVMPLVPVHVVTFVVETELKK